MMPLLPVFFLSNFFARLWVILQNSNLKNQAKNSSETFVSIDKSTRRRNIAEYKLVGEVF